MKLRPIINKKRFNIEEGNNKYIILIMLLVGLIVGGFFVGKFLLNISR